MVLIVAIIGMIIIMVRERNRVLVIETEAQTIHRVQHNMKTRSHTDNFGENNVKCLIAKGICRFVPHSSAGGF